KVLRNVVEDECGRHNKILTGLFGKKAKAPGQREPRALLETVTLRVRGDLHEDDDQREQRQGLDKGQSKRQQQQDTRPGAWIARQRLRSRRSGAALAQAAKAGRQ